MYIFALNVKGAPIDKLYKGILKTNDWICIERFSEAFKIADYNNLIQLEYKKIISSGCIASFCSKYSYRFMREFLGYLLDNIDDEINQVILRIYYDFLKRDSGYNDADRKKLDLEYQTYIESLRQESDIVKPKTKKKSLSVYSLIHNEKKK